MNLNFYSTKDYERNDIFAVPENKANSNPISEKPKMNVNLYVIEDYENETTLRPQKNKPNSNPISTTPKGVKQKSDAGCQRSDICFLFSAFCFLSSVQGPQPQKTVDLCIEKDCKRFDFGGWLGYNSSNKVPMGPEEVIWKIVVKGAFSVKLKFLAN